MPADIEANAAADDEPRRFLCIWLIYRRVVQLSSVFEAGHQAGSRVVDSSVDSSEKGVALALRRHSRVDGLVRGNPQIRVVMNFV